MDTVNDRIDYLVKIFAEGSNTRFAQMINSSEANVRNYRKNVQPNLEIIKGICLKFEIRYEWILEGKEPMHQNKEENTENKTLTNENPYIYLDKKDRHIFALEDHIKTLKNIIAELKEKISFQEKMLEEAGKKRG